MKEEEELVVIMKTSAETAHSMSVLVFIVIYMAVCRRFTGLRAAGKGRPSCQHTVQFTCGVSNLCVGWRLFEHEVVEVCIQGFFNLDSGWHRTTSVATLTSGFSQCVMSLVFFFISRRCYGI